ncbi:anaerobic ribonucleoside-triphosphate reductase activating protein [Tissierella creatinophila]|uniref:Anaerobic ribonucleoside-triphosphate reductase-activating protein n=1 Tax=Tissierella creatinophila DSM 6911 TaxID=1123403 RepID=A0A1U7M4M3_TISCR|nr:anaerobic ribonucleoside-triphosphate reductase activating protein [Tissierella creatinophila]OLS02200.1 anaerobic ribonucleotide reductase-activating protein [Tissierella creatinophila DSM 6911]
MKYAQIRKYDVANGLGVRTSIFVTGCTHNCFNCFNKEYQDFDFGKPWTKKETQTIIEYLNNDHISGLSILGGEPMQNANDLTSLVKEVKQHSNKDIWLWSGYTYEEVIKHEDRRKLLEEIDVLVDGRFIESKKDLTLKFRGSSNQRVIDVKKSLSSGMIVIFEE